MSSSSTHQIGALPLKTACIDHTARPRNAEADGRDRRVREDSALREGGIYIYRERARDRQRDIAPETETKRAGEDPTLVERTFRAVVRFWIQPVVRASVSEALQSCGYSLAGTSVS